MSWKFLAFDLEIASESQRDWQCRENLGITCAAVHAEDVPPVVWYAGEDSDKPASRMRVHEARRLVERLQQFVDAGYTPVTWNGHSFDFRVAGSGVRVASGLLGTVTQSC